MYVFLLTQSVFVGQDFQLQSCCVGGQFHHQVSLLGQDTGRRPVDQTVSSIELEHAYKINVDFDYGCSAIADGNGRWMPVMTGSRVRVGAALPPHLNLL